MEILLVDNAPFNATRGTSSDTLLKCSVANRNPRTVRGNKSHANYTKKVLAASNGKQYCIHINKNPANPNDHYHCVLRLHGFLSENFESLWVQGLRVRIQLSFVLNGTAGTYVFQARHLQMCAEIPILKSSESSSAAVDSVDEMCITNGSFLEATDVSVYNWNFLFASQLGSNPAVGGCATITLLCDSNNWDDTQNSQLAVFKTPSHGIAHVTRSILESNLYFDVIISAKDGSEHNCLKAFLATQSSVLKAMLETDMKESRGNQIEMKDMSSHGVKALLEYLYTFELDQAIEKCDIALELLEGGHKYDIESLEKDVSSLILSKNEEWFSVDMAFSLFLFTRKVEDMKDIKMKAASMLMKKPKEFLECEAYVKEQQENLAEVAAATKSYFALQL